MVRAHLFSRRAVSVPPSDYRLSVDTPVGSKAYLISSHAVQDNDAMSARSRRNDANFLHDVSNKMATAHLGNPYLHNSTYVGNRYPVTTSYPNSYTTYPHTIYPNHYYYPSDYRRRTYYAPPVTDYEVDSYLAGGPGRYYSRFNRAGSVPPVLPSSSSYGPRWQTSPRWTPSASLHRRASLAPYADVLGVAHTAQYGDIVIGIPHNKSHMLQDNNHYKGGNNYKSYYYPSFAGNRHSIAPSYKYENGPTTGPRDSVAALRGRAQSVQKQLEGIPEFQFFDTVAPSGVSITRPRAASSIPTYTAAGSSVKTTPSAYVPYSGASSAYSGGFSGGSSAGTGGSSAGAGGLPVPGKYTKAPVSETRRKVRDLLCKSKNNPHYFD